MHQRIVINNDNTIYDAFDGKRSKNNKNNQKIKNKLEMENISNATIKDTIHIIVLNKPIMLWCQYIKCWIFLLLSKRGL